MKRCPEQAQFYEHTFFDAFGDEDKQDARESVLFAQLHAHQCFDARRQGRQWFACYSAYLLALGWELEYGICGCFEAVCAKDELLAQALNAVEGFGGCFLRALAARSLQADSRAETGASLFLREDACVEGGHFQMVASAGARLFSGWLSYTARRSVGHFGWWHSDSYSLTLQQSGCGLRFSRADYGQHRHSVRDELRAAAVRGPDSP